MGRASETIYKCVPHSLTDLWRYYKCFIIIIIIIIISIIMRVSEIFSHFHMVLQF